MSLGVPAAPGGDVELTWDHVDVARRAELGEVSRRGCPPLEVTTSSPRVDDKVVRLIGLEEVPGCSRCDSR